MNFAIETNFTKLNGLTRPEVKTNSEIIDKILEKKEKKEQTYTHENAVMDLEAIKRYLYMLAGMQYVPKNEFGYEKRSEIWA